MIAISPDSEMLPITDHSLIADARRRIGQLAVSLGFNDTRRGKIEIIASELSTNLNLHARGGYLLVRSHGLDEGIEIMAVDRGPGMANVQECMRDGYSTAGTAGNGLGAVRRLAQTFDIFSQPGIGTVVLAQMFKSETPKLSKYLIGAVTVALPGELACGDAWTASITARGARLAMADGLGHGIEAAQASLKAMRSVELCPGQPTEMVLANAHQALSHTRGAAMAVCDIDADTNVARFAGVGNIAGVIVRDGVIRSMMSHNGTVGHLLLKAQEFSYPWSKESVLVMHSDGLTTRWSFDPTPGLAMRHPSVIAAILHRDFSRGRDDVGVAVLRERT